jgi:BA14K-like protein
MGSKTALRLSMLAAGAAFAAVPAFAQQMSPSPQLSSHAPKYMRSAAAPQKVENGRAIRSNGYSHIWYRRGRVYDYVPGRYYGYYDYYPIAPGPAVGTVTWCGEHFRTYNPATGMYRGYDGLFHRCG